VHVGLIGTGRIGALHARTLSENELVSHLTIVDTDAQRAAAVARELSAAQAESPQALLDLGVDALVIAAATPAHAELLHLAADASVPAFCEKPIALDLATTDAVIRHVERTGIFVQIGFQRRFDAGYRAAREAHRAGALGEVHVVHLVTHDPAPPSDAYVAASGGIWRDLAIHDFDIGAWVLDSRITEVFAAGQAHSQVFADNHDVDAASAALRFENGAVGSLSATRNDARGYDVRMEIFGLRDSVAVGWDGRTPLRSIEPGVEAPTMPGYRDFIDRFEPAYRAELHAFLAAVRDRAESACTVTEARDAFVVALAADCSLRERRPVRVEEFT
jgi:myo-inositol 2-dehydrogenase / D-chiro-inositol 1-dehydrogenase